ncbi:hypothetical protein [Calothrix sp. UHCC 0171]|uniref:hypothetical protein n=1 Tax=Calothrix sp. UHCC 0171 TaxID=3110245 RepID=UPI002B214F6C|nr:hypothetical protein [Calothrix sp. UHCC 0171]MEA5573090.1 hypothetical protein [Calothrix sp. UHCC 0171]
MSMSSTGKPTSPRQKRATLKGETIMEVENNQAQSTSTDKVAVKAEAKEAKAETKDTKVANKVEPTTKMSAPAESSKGNEISSKLQVREEKTLAISGIRPIGASNLEFAGTFSAAGIRPIGISHLQVIETMNIMGIRPIGANEIDVIDTINLSGIRPISSSSLVVSESYSVMGNRPVASNETDETPVLMGFLD